ncbi:hypothetical protein [Chroococcidiopsis sp.]|uniref:hypothetical protein n=1 Tax=Chroococcidiopsis sp. TaxID=3088168 RepID=UPI003F327AC9
MGEFAIIVIGHWSLVIGSCSLSNLALPIAPSALFPQLPTPGKKRSPIRTIIELG